MKGFRGFRRLAIAGAAVVHANADISSERGTMAEADGCSVLLSGVRFASRANSAASLSAVKSSAVDKSAGGAAECSVSAASRRPAIQSASVAPGQRAVDDIGGASASAAPARSSLTRSVKPRSDNRRQRAASREARGRGCDSECILRKCVNEMSEAKPAAFVRQFIRLVHADAGVSCSDCDPVFVEPRASKTR